MSKEDFLKEVVANLRACLVSTKGKCDLRQLNRDYKLLMGTDIPYQKLGFSNLERFICSVPSLTTSRVNNILVVDAKLTEKSSHISALVNSQKTRKRSRPSAPKSSRFYSAPTRSKWQPKNVKKTYQSSPRPAAVKHNQFTNVPSSPPKEQNTLASRLASRLGPRPPLLKMDSSLALNKDSSLDDVFTKTKERLSKKIEAININDSSSLKSDGLFRDAFSAKENMESIKFFPPSKENMESVRFFPPSNLNVEPMTPKSAPIAHMGHPFSYPNTLNSSNVDREFMSPPVRKQPVATFVTTGNFLEDLKRFATFHNLDDPQIKVLTRQMKPRKRTCYDCHIKVGTHSFSSYPQDFFNEMDAVQEAAKQALEELMPIYARRQSLLISDDFDVLQRIPPIVQSHYHGIWKDQLEADYTEKFSEQLPINWLEVVDSLPNISVTSCLDKFVLRYCKPGEGFQKGMASSMQFVSNISVPTVLAAFDGNGMLTAEITCPISASEIWCRQIYTPEAISFESMTAYLDKYCNDPKNLEQIETVDEGGYYIALAEEGLVWCRVRAFDVADDYVNCFCIDYGDELMVKRNELYALPRQFARDQAQAFACRLAGVEEFYEASKSTEYIGNLSGKIVHVHLQETDDSDDQTYNVILVDIEDDTVINEQLGTCVETAMYTSPELKDIPMEVYLTHVEDSGLVYVHVPYFGSNQLKIMLDDLEKSISNNEIDLPRRPVTPESSKGKLYFVEGNKHHWYRTKILDWSPIQKQYAQIQYVDYGITAVINVDETPMYLLEDLNGVAAKFDEQAKPARFALKSIPSNFSEIITRLIPEDKPVLAKIVSWESDNIPILKFFKRSEPDNLLFSINDAINAKSEVRGLDVNGKSQSNKLQKLMFLNQNDSTKVPSTGLLQCPQLPTKGEFFDVRIPCAVNPYNFFIQPHDSRHDLLNLMKDLQERCNNIQYSPLAIQDILPGKIYASKYNTGQWYRTSIIKVINSDSISVFYCDYGYYANLTVQQLVPLDEHFLLLPYQAIKAKLYGIQPKHSKWSMDDCRFFEHLVCRKNLVSILMGIEKDPYCRCDTVLTLKLCDTSTSNDVYIDQILIQEGIAIAAQ